MISVPSRSTTGRSAAKYSGTIGKLGPVAEREDPDRLPGLLVGVVKRPELGTLALGVPAVLGITEREHALFGSAALFVAASAAERDVESVLVKRLLERDRLHDVGVNGRAVVERIDPPLDTVLIGMNDEVEAVLASHLCAERDHFLELPRRVDVEERKGWPGRIESLQREVHHHRE